MLDLYFSVSIGRVIAPLAAAAATNVNLSRLIDDSKSDSPLNAGSVSSYPLALSWFYLALRAPKEPAWRAGQSITQTCAISEISFPVGPARPGTELNDRRVVLLNLLRAGVRQRLYQMVESQPDTPAVVIKDNWE